MLGPVGCVAVPLDITSANDNSWNAILHTHTQDTHTHTDCTTAVSTTGALKKVAHTRLPSVAFWSWSRFLSVSLHVMWVINLAVGCHNFPLGLQLPPQPLRGLLPILLLGEQRHNGCEQFARQRRGCDLNPGSSAPESSTLYHSATEPPRSHNL